MTERPAILTGQTYKTKSPEGTLYVTINEDDDNSPVEVFLSIGRSGAVVGAASEALGRIISVGLRSGISLDKIQRQLRGISHDRARPMTAPDEPLSFPDAVAKVFKVYLEEARNGD